MKSLIYKFFAIVALMAAFTACEDDTDIFDEAGLKPGERRVNLTMSFEPVADVSLQSRSDGGKIADLRNLYIALFGPDGAKLKSWYYEQGTSQWNSLTFSSTTGGEDGDVIRQAKLPIVLPYSGNNMYLVAVANTGNIDVKYDEVDMATLRSHTVDWVKGGANDQMAGYFKNEREEKPLGTEALRDGGIPTIKVNASATELHAWLRRAASKVTVAFNAENLRENVWIYIQDVRLVDIPRSCHLIDINTPSADADLIKTDDEILDYSGGSSDYRQWPTLSKGSPRLDSDENVHSGTSPNSLFFYENMQGKGKNKAQITDGGSVPTHPEGVDKNNKYWKDQKPYGTYVEVHAHYYSMALNNQTEGNIVYRFMLGKNISDDYNAERNHHYKLTLNFQGNANDVDWHIEYEADEGIVIPSPYYISYLYGQRMFLPVGINNLTDIKDKDDVEITVDAEILSSNWYPDAPAVAGIDYYDNSKLETSHKGPQTGFLSLQPTEYSNMGKPNYVGRGQSSDHDYLLKYWQGSAVNPSVATVEGQTVPPQGSRSFTFAYENGTYEGVALGDLYQVTVDKTKNNCTLYMPLYTRAFQLVKEWSYTGNNPYERFTRSAKLQLTVYVTASDNGVRKTYYTYTRTIDITQVPRIYNPKGVYRRNGNNKPFKVTLMEPVNAGYDYQPFVSKGPWSAEIESHSPNSKITINGTASSVTGSTDTNISFNINFSSSASDVTNQYAVILVRYHNYTCNHRIIVRQGYDPDIVSAASTTRWHCFNLRTAGIETESPIEAGSLFRYGNLRDAIDETNSLKANAGFNYPATSTYTTLLTTSLDVLDAEGNSSQKTWGASDYRNPPNTETYKNIIYYCTYSLQKTANQVSNWFPNTNLSQGHIKLNNGKEARIARYHDFATLRDEGDCEYNFGVCYADDATVTATKAIDGGSYIWSQSSTHSYGMLGAFVYNRSTAHNIFLPAGCKGYGTRVYNGPLRYAGTYKELSSATYRPLLWLLYKNYGAQYWLGDNLYTIGNPWTPTTYSHNTAWDINISTFDFNTLNAESHNNDTSNETTSTVGGTRGSNACYIRLVED